MSNILLITDIINNAKDELERSLELLKENEDAIDSMLVSDIEMSLERMADLNERIEFALILANYAGAYDALGKTVELTDSATWRKRYLHAASEIEFVYEEGYIDSDWAYTEAEDIVANMFE